VNAPVSPDGSFAAHPVSVPKEPRIWSAAPEIALELCCVPRITDASGAIEARNATGPETPAIGVAG
jgi:hypothetical protein